jgi:phage terminase small subunit
MRGRKPKLISEKIARGNPGRRTLTTIVGPPRPGDMLCPNSVAGNERAAAYWRMYLDNVAPGHLNPVDAPLLAKLCLALAYSDEANDRMVESGGILVKDRKTGLPTENPFMRVMARQTDTARRLAIELALPPAQRNRLGPVAHPAAHSPAIDAAWEALDE